jgi:hypothetical protein
MEAIAYLSLRQDYDDPHAVELRTNELSGKAAIGLVGAACVAGSLALGADSASAYPCSYGYYPSYYNYYSYTPYYSYYPSSYYSYTPYYSYYPSSYYNSYYSYYPSSYYNSYYDYTPYYSYYDYHYDAPAYYSYPPYSYDSSAYYSYTPNYYSYFRDWYAIYYPVSPSTTEEAESMTSDIYQQYVIGIQTKLTELGYYTAGVDGDYGAATAEAVAIYQADHGLTADGVVGPETGKSLGLGWSY